MMLSVEASQRDTISLVASKSSDARHGWWSGHRSSASNPATFSTFSARRLTDGAATAGHTEAAARASQAFSKVPYESRTESEVELRDDASTLLDLSQVVEQAVAGGIHRGRPAFGGLPVGGAGDERESGEEARSRTLSVVARWTKASSVAPHSLTR